MPFSTNWANTWSQARGYVRTYEMLLNGFGLQNLWFGLRTGTLTMVRCNWKKKKKFQIFFKKSKFFFPQANGHACVDFWCTHPIDGLFWSLPIYLLYISFTMVRHNWKRKNTKKMVTSVGTESLVHPRRPIEHAHVSYTQSKDVTHTLGVKLNAKTPLPFPNA